MAKIVRKRHSYRRLKKAKDLGDNSKAGAEYAAREANSHGYDFTADEFLKFFESEPNSTEFSDDVLAGVAGGRKSKGILDAILFFLWLKK